MAEVHSATWREDLAGWSTRISQAETDTRGEFGTLPSTDEEVLEEYRSLIAENPDDLALRLRAAEFASGIPEHQTEAIDWYREAVAMAPLDREATLGLAEVLAWDGQLTEAIDLYRSLLLRNSADNEVRLGLARTLSWDGQYTEAIRHFSVLAEADPADLEARHGLAQALSWSGRFSEAIVQYGALLDADGDDVELLLGRARAARWRGDRELARRDIESAMALAPADARLFAELAQLDLGGGRLGSASRAADRAIALDPTLTEALEVQASIERMTATEIGFHETYSEEGGNFTRLVHSLRGIFFPLPETSLRLDASWTQFDDPQASLQRWTLGLEVRQQLPLRMVGQLLYRAHILQDAALTHEVGGEIAVPIGDAPIQVHAGGRYRALVDSPTSSENVAFLEGVGSGGTTMVGIRERIQVAEGYLGITVSPLAGIYLYAEDTVGWIDDGNRSTSVGAGAGVNLFRVLDILPSLDLTGTYDYYYLACDDESSFYYSPDELEVHAPGFNAAWRPRDDWILGAHAALPMITYGGYFSIMVVEPVQLVGRIHLSDQPYYSSLRCTVGLSLRL